MFESATHICNPYVIIASAYLWEGRCQRISIDIFKNKVLVLQLQNCVIVGLHLPNDVPLEPHRLRLPQVYKRGQPIPLGNCLLHSLTGDGTLDILRVAVDNVGLRTHRQWPDNL